MAQSNVKGSKAQDDDAIDEDYLDEIINKK